MGRPYRLYDILSVTPDAEPAVVEAAYRALMKQHHPDHAGASARAAEINEAFAVLRDPAKRAAYDHREWARKQAALAAEAQRLAPPPRASGRTGWLVAALLGCIVAALAGERYGLGIVPERVAQGAAPPAARPDEPAVAAVAPPAPPELIATTGGAMRDASPVAVASVAALDEAAAATTVEPVPPVLRRREPDPAPPRPPRDRRDDAEREFLEREGFIY